MQQIIDSNDILTNRKFTSYPVNNFAELKIQMLNWTNQFNIFCFLDNHHYNFLNPAFECVLAAGAFKSLETPAGNAFERLDKFVKTNKDWAFGHLSYDLKNEIEELSSSNIDNINFPDLYFFIPEVLVFLSSSEIKISAINNNTDKIFQEILSSSVIIASTKQDDIPFESRFAKEEYISSVKQLQQHILRGDCYEINFCQEFFANKINIDPLSVFDKLNRLSPNPFSAFYKKENNYLLCASPERFLKKADKKIYSQPIKGTVKRNIEDEKNDQENKNKLLNSDKERSENVMIVDLVRNDLSKICEEGSVRVEELFGLYSFPQVHQMISTISGILQKNKQNFADILPATFPMGSMTGAPKKRVMELIEKYEKTKRGIFSGALGYITPEGNFDFNVVIRSIIYNQKKSYLSIQAGSAITFNSVPEKEFEECLLKIEVLKKALS